MREAAVNACGFTDGMSFDDFQRDKRTEQAVMMSLLIIGESAAKAIANDTELQSKYSQIDWIDIRGMRNQIAHGYVDIEFEIVWETVQVELPKLIKNIDEILNQENNRV